MEEVYNKIKKPGQKFSGIFLTQGSAGTLGCADYAKEKFPHTKIAAGEAKQCPTLLYNGFGAHRIEGIGDKHVPWIHNIRNMDLTIDVDDEYTMRLVRLFNEPAGHAYLKKVGVDPEIVDKLDLLGISSIANLLGSIKLAKYYEMDENDIVFTVATDSMELYQSRLKEMFEEYGDYTELDAAKDYDTCLQNIGTDWMLEMSYWDKKRMHNLKYFTWIEQQGKTSEELEEQWYNENYWSEKFNSYKLWDELIQEFNDRVGLIKKYQ